MFQFPLAKDKNFYREKYTFLLHANAVSVCSKKVPKQIFKKFHIK